jgi:dephospho-CoA kinase
MIIFIVVGMPASGKNIARMYAESEGIPYFATGDIVRAEITKRGLYPDTANTAAVSTDLRGKDGLGVTRHALAAAMETKGKTAFMEGMRSWPEIELIRGQTNCIVIAFVASRKLRMDRIVSRGRADDSPDAFEERDTREIAYGAAVPIALADEYVLNTSAMEASFNDIGRIIGKYTG